MPALSYVMWVKMTLDDMMHYIDVHANLSQTVKDEIMTIATVSRINNKLQDDQHVKDLCSFMEKVIYRFVRGKIVGDYKNVTIECDSLHTHPFHCFFPFEVGLSRNVITQINFESSKALNCFKLKEPTLYQHLVKNEIKR